jgi:hypothetical protein
VNAGFRQPETNGTLGSNELETRICARFVISSKNLGIPNVFLAPLSMIDQVIIATLVLAQGCLVAWVSMKTAEIGKRKIMIRSSIFQAWI